jgi:Ca2+-binding RTX toxin-like protein
MRRLVLVLTLMAATLVLGSGMALAVNKIGTNGPDTLKGTNTNDVLLGRDGQDDLFSLDGTDNLLGGQGRDNVWAGTERRPGRGDKNLQGGFDNDAVLGGLGSDSVIGGPGNDLVDGYRGSDNIVGEEGNDLLIDGGGAEAYKDTLSGGPGDDVFIVDNKPPFGDVVTCGSGFDRVAADKKDVVAADCEKVAVGPAATKALLKEIPKAEKEAFNEGLPPQP